MDSKIFAVIIIAVIGIGAVLFMLPGDNNELTVIEPEPAIEEVIIEPEPEPIVEPEPEPVYTAILKIEIIQKK